jgi:hypothetical protein
LSLNSLKIWRCQSGEFRRARPHPMMWWSANPNPSYQPPIIRTLPKSSGQKWYTQSLRLSNVRLGSRSLPINRRRKAPLAVAYPTCDKSPCVRQLIQVKVDACDSLHRLIESCCPRVRIRKDRNDADRPPVRRLRFDWWLLPHLSVGSALGFRILAKGSH